MLRKTDLWVSRGALRQLQGLMPLSEFHYAARSNLDSSQCKQTPALSPDLPSTMSDSDFIELLWENGQIVMQGQSGRPKKPPVASAHPFHSSRFPDKDCGDGVTGRPARPTMLIGSPGGDFAPAMIPGATAAALNSSQEDDMAPWINYSIDDYYSELLNDFTGVNANPLPPGNSGNLGLPDKGTATSSTGLNQIVRDLYDVEPHIPRSLAVTNMSEAGRARSGLVNQLPHQWQNSVQNSRSKPLDFGGAGSSMVTGQSPGWDLPNCAKAPRQEVVCSPKPPVPPTPSTSSGVINFSHFSRPASLLKANLHNASRLRSSEKTSTLITNPMESTLVSSPGAMKSNAQEHLPLISRKPILRPPTPPPLQELAAGTSQSETLSWRDAGVRNASASAAAAATPAKITDKRPPENVPAQRMGSISIVMPPQNAQHGTEKSLETVLAPSSVCSANGGATESIVPSHRAKRKSTEEESGYQSDDVEDESVGGAKKQPTTRTTSSKRSRAAEVHNQSERRRRDRINEKMRALQELIPNCNKVDKASMLDEAIEYLKSLQLQLQIMSMGGGFCMPPMMLPPAMQRLRSPHMAHFPPMGVGMGMGVGYGMGILDINGNPLLPLPPVPSTQFPCSSMGAATGLQSMAPSTTSGHPMFGIPSPGVPVPMHCAPPFVALAPHSAWPNPAPEVVGTATGTAPPVVVDPAGSKDDYQQNMGTETSLRQGGVKQLPPKSQREKERASSPMTNDGASNSDGHTNSCAGNGNSSSGGSYD